MPCQRQPDLKRCCWTTGGCGPLLLLLLLLDYRWVRPSAAAAAAAWNPPTRAAYPRQMAVPGGTFLTFFSAQRKEAEAGACGFRVWLFETHVGRGVSFAVGLLVPEARCRGPKGGGLQGSDQGWQHLQGFTRASFAAATVIGQAVVMLFGVYTGVLLGLYSSAVLQSRTV
jgi:hypothetical protein